MLQKNCTASCWTSSWNEWKNAGFTPKTGHYRCVQREGMETTDMPWSHI
jgi:hypothetical protein